MTSVRRYSSHGLPSTQHRQLTIKHNLEQLYANKNGQASSTNQRANDEHKNHPPVSPGALQSRDRTTATASKKMQSEIAYLTRKALDQEKIQCNNFRRACPVCESLTSADKGQYAYHCGCDRNVKSYSQKCKYKELKQQQVYDQTRDYEGYQPGFDVTRLNAEVADRLAHVDNYVLNYTKAYHPDASRHMPHYREDLSNRPVPIITATMAPAQSSFDWDDSSDGGDSDDEALLSAPSTRSSASSDKASLGRKMRSSFASMTSRSSKSLQASGGF